MKGIKRDLFGHQIWVDGEVLRFDHELADLRGFLEAPGSDEFRLTAEGDYSKSRVGGKKLVDVIGDPAETEEYHRDVAGLITKAVVDAKDSMASDPARRCAKSVEILKKVGLKRAAHYCEIMRDVDTFARGYDATPRENLGRIEQANRKLEKLRDACKRDLEQGSRGMQRNRGFISEVLFRLLKQVETAWRGVIQLAEANGRSEGLRSTPMFSAVNETEHGVMRRVCPSLQISAVAREMGKVLVNSALVHDLARPWLFPVGAGAESCYQLSLDDGPKVRRAAMVEFRKTRRRAFVLKCNEGHCLIIYEIEILII